MLSSLPRLGFAILFGGLIIFSTAPAPSQSIPQADLQGDPLPSGAVARLGTIRWRHGGAGNVLVYSPDGKMLVSGGSGGMLRFWDLTNGRELRRVPVKEKMVNVIVFAPDGTRLAAAGSEGRVCVIDPVSGKEITNFYPTAKGVFALAFSPDGKFLATGGHEGVTTVFDLAKDRQFHFKGGHESTVTSVAFAPDGKVLATASSDQTVRIWDPTARKEVARIQGEQVEYQSLAFAPDGKMLAVAGTRSDPDRSEDRIRLWDLAHFMERWQVRPDARQIKQLVVRLDNKSFVVRQQAAQELSWLGALAEPALTEALENKPPLEVQRRIEDLLDRLKKGPQPPGPVVHTLTAVDQQIRAIAFSRDGQTLAVAERAGLRFWNTRTGKETQLLPSRFGNIGTLALARDGPSLAYTDGTCLFGLAVLQGNGKDQRWEPTTLRQAITQGSVSVVEALTFSPDGRTVASCCTGDSVIRLWESATGREIRQLQGVSLASSSLVFSADGKTLAVGGDTGEGIGIRAWRTTTYDEIRTIRLPGRWWMFGVRFSPDGKTAGASQWSETDMNGTIHRWDMATGEELGQPLRWRDIRSAPALFADGRLVAVGDSQKGLRIKDVTTGQELHHLAGHTDEVGKVIVSPNGKYLASTGDLAKVNKKDVRLWESTTGRESQLLEISNGQAQALAFSPDSKTLATGGNDGTIRLWETSTGQLMKSFVGQVPIECLAFSADGRRLAAGGVDTAVVIWQIK